MSEERTVKLGEIASINMGQSPDSKYYNDSKLGLPLIQGNADIKDRKSIQRIFTTSPTKICDVGDIIMTVRAPVGSIGISSDRSCLGRGVCGIKAMSINERYLYHLLISKEDSWKQLEQGSTFTAVGSKEIFNYKLSILKSVTAQQQVAKILDTCDTVISQTQSTIAKYKAIKQGMLHDLFTRGLDTNGRLRPTCQEAPELYKESELGMIPKEWEVKRLGECTSYVDYRGKTPPKSDKGIILVTAKNIRFGFIDYELSKEYIHEYAFESTMSRGKASTGDVLITTEAPMGNVAQIDKEGIALAQRVIKYQGNKDELNNDFLKLALMSDGFQKTLSSEATGSTALGIKGSRLHKLKISIPQINEQQKIASQVKIIDDKIRSEENLLQKYQSIKRGLMGDLLGGKRSVNYGKIKTD